MYHIKKFKVFLAWDHFWKSKGSKGLRPPCYLLTSPALPGLSSPHNNFNVPKHGLRTPGEKMVFTARPKIQSQSQIFRYGRSIFCLPHQPKFSDFFDFCLRWVSVVHADAAAVAGILLLCIQYTCRAYLLRYECTTSAWRSPVLALAQLVSLCRLASLMQLFQVLQGRTGSLK